MNQTVKIPLKLPFKPPSTPIPPQITHQHPSSPSFQTVTSHKHKSRQTPPTVSNSPQNHQNKTPSSPQTSSPSKNNPYSPPKNHIHPKPLLFLLLLGYQPLTNLPNLESTLAKKRGSVQPPRTLSLLFLVLFSWSLHVVHVVYRSWLEKGSSSGHYDYYLMLAQNGKSSYLTVEIDALCNYHKFQQRLPTPRLALLNKVSARWINGPIHWLSVDSVECSNQSHLT